MTTHAFDILGIGNAIVDVLARADDAFLARHGMARGSMALIGPEDAERIYRDMGPGVESSGGSGANTCAAAAALGAKVCYLGKVADDTLGQVFRHDITAAGVQFPSPSPSSPARSSPSTKLPFPAMRKGATPPTTASFRARAPIPRSF